MSKLTPDIFKEDGEWNWVISNLKMYMNSVIPVRAVKEWGLTLTEYYIHEVSGLSVLIRQCNTPDGEPKIVYGGRINDIFYIAETKELRRIKDTKFCGVKNQQLY